MTDHRNPRLLSEIKVVEEENLQRKIYLLKVSTSNSKPAVDTLGAFPFAYMFLTCSGGWKRRYLKFGTTEGYDIPGLEKYIHIHRRDALASSEKVNWCLSNAAHASVTGIGLAFIVKERNLDVLINIINLVLPVKDSHLMYRLMSLTYS